MKNLLFIGILILRLVTCGYTCEAGVPDGKKGTIAGASATFPLPLIWLLKVIRIKREFRLPTEASVAEAVYAV